MFLFFHFGHFNQLSTDRENSVLNFLWLASTASLHRVTLPWERWWTPRLAPSLRWRSTSRRYCEATVQPASATKRLWSRLSPEPCSVAYSSSLWVGQMNTWLIIIIIKKTYWQTVKLDSVCPPAQGICMIIGGIKHREQRFNSRSAGVSSALLFISVGGACFIVDIPVVVETPQQLLRFRCRRHLDLISLHVAVVCCLLIWDTCRKNGFPTVPMSSPGVFAPTLFSKTFGNLMCESCASIPGNSSVPFICKDCHYDTVGHLITVFLMSYWTFSIFERSTHPKFWNKLLNQVFFASIFLLLLESNWSTSDSLPNRVSLTCWISKALFYHTADKGF